MSVSADTTEKWVLTIKADPRGKDQFGRPPNYRLRLLLKLMLRTFGFRVVRLQQEGTISNDSKKIGA
jgi:hypothetical protein